MSCICISQQIHQGRQYRITDLSREHTEELIEKIQRLIEMADCTYFEQKRISRSFEEEITQIKKGQARYYGQPDHCINQQDPAATI
jgi:hypothetical protein